MVLNKTTEHLFDSAHLYKLLSSLIVQRNYFSFTLFFLLPNYLFKSFASLGFPYPFRLFLNVSFLCLYIHIHPKINYTFRTIGIQEKFFAFPFSERVSSGERGTTMLYRRTCAIKMDTRERPWNKKRERVEASECFVIMAYTSTLLFGHKSKRELHLLGWKNLETSCGIDYYRFLPFSSFRQ